MTRNEEIENQKKLEDKLMFYMCNNDNAVRFLIDFIYVCHLWDDLIDKDKQRTDNEINDAFRICLIDIQVNPFFDANKNYLIPIILNVILEWEDANVLEKGLIDEKNKAYMLRAGLFSLISFCSLLCGGKEWARTQGPAIRNLYEETLEDFLLEMEG